jgi:hypothetical protein
VERQDGCCGICRSATTDLRVDHDHSTGAVRGLLCHTCNSGLGMLGDDIAAVRAALAYLSRSTAL